MGKPYSVDLRLRVLAALDGGLTKMQAHKTFNVSRTTLEDWLQLREQTGSVQVLPARSPQKGLHHHESFAGFIERHRHSTLGQMSLAWQEEHKQSLSLMSFSRALRVAGQTRKKRVISVELSLQRATRRPTATLQATGSTHRTRRPGLHR